MITDSCDASHVAMSDACVVTLFSTTFSFMVILAWIGEMCIACSVLVYAWQGCYLFAARPLRFADSALPVTRHVALPAPRAR